MSPHRRTHHRVFGPGPVADYDLYGPGAWLCVIFIIFIAGLEVDVAKLRAIGKAGIRVATLTELDHLNSLVIKTVLSTALMDDIIGLTSLAIISGMADPNVHFYMVVLKLLGYFLFAALIYASCTKILRWFDYWTWEKTDALVGEA